MRVAEMSRNPDEPWFVRFRRELVHHGKSALSNPAQFLRVLTGQEALHHPFTIVSDKQRKRNSKSVCSTGIEHTAARNERLDKIREHLSEEREQRAVEKGQAALDSGSGGVFASFPLLERCSDPESADRLLLDILLGTGRVVDDLRSLRNLRRTLVMPHAQLETLQRAIVHLSATIRGMQPLRLAIQAEDVNELCEQLRSYEIIPGYVQKTLRHWFRRLGNAHQVARNRPLDFLECDAGLIAVGNDCSLEAWPLADQLQSSKRCVAHMGARTSRAYSASELRVLASRLLLLCDIAGGNEYLSACTCTIRAKLKEAQAISCEILREVISEEGRQGLESVHALHLHFLGDQLQLAPRKNDSRVPWPPDRWQRELLDAVDEGVGVLVSAPTSAGKTFAAYYAMERVLRVSNTGAVVFVAPTDALAAQVEAEVHARFSQKPYPHDGYALCSRWGRRMTSKAQVIVAVAEDTEDILLDDNLWARLQWVICDEIHMQPLRGLKALAQRCGRASVPLLAMSATVQNPKRMQERLAEATKCPGFKIICHHERVVDLHTFHWDAAGQTLHVLHPLLLLTAESIRNAAIPHMAPAHALQVWQCLHKLAPDQAVELEPQFFLLKRRIGPLAKHLPQFLCIQQVRSTLAEFLGRGGLMLREEFRAWERDVARAVQTIDGTASSEQVLSSLAKQLAPRSLAHTAGGSPGESGPQQLSNLLRELKGAELLPCLCFHSSAERLEVLLLGLAELFDSREELLLQESAEERAKKHAEQRAAWQSRRQTLKENLDEARTRARGVLMSREEAEYEENRQKRAAELQVARRLSAEQSRVQQYEKLKELLSEHRVVGEVLDPLLQISHVACDVQLLRSCFECWHVAVEGTSHRSDMWGHQVEVSDRRENAVRKRTDVEGDLSVRAARAALEAHEECGPPELEGRSLISDYDFTAMRPKHTYKSEIELLLELAETELYNLSRRRGNKLWLQSMTFALRRGVAMHFSDDQAEGLNFAVQLLFRIGHVRVLLADEALSCGMNLPCRTVVILDSQIRGAALTQMAGRAGRRGLDLFGTTVYVHDLETIKQMHAA